VIRNPLAAKTGTTPPVVVHMPTGRDAALVADLLGANGHGVASTATPAGLAERLDGDVGAVVLGEEALEPETARVLLDVLGSQPSWSDLPIIVLTSARRGPEAPLLSEIREAWNVTLLERPVLPVTLLSAVRAALRARSRQFQVQDYLAERTRHEEQVRRRQRIEAVGKLAGGVAHEVNNMMTAVLGFTEMALRRLNAAHPAAADLREVTKAAGRTARITQQLLAFSRQQHTQPEPLSLADVVRDLTTLLEHSLGAEYTLDLAIHDRVPLVLADRTQLDQVIINLILNARDASPAGSAITVTVEPVELDGNFPARHPDVAFRPGTYVLLAVGDSGHGMDQQTIDRAFEPFYTTKPVGQGTGLGLSTVYGIVKQSEGYVWLYSELGQGTTVKVYLPVVGTSETTSERLAPVRLHGRERVLVVEDEDMVRSIARRTLEEFGYQVSEAADGRAAVELLASSPIRVDLVLCDVVMPGLSGSELEAEIHRVAPDARILYTSGYTGNDARVRNLVRPSDSFIQKPFSAADLAARVRALLDRDETAEPRLSGGYQPSG
jgi:signal transduction histidine kinase/ActR/RegA family two-component response regulator